MHRLQFQDFGLLLCPVSKNQVNLKRELQMKRVDHDKRRLRLFIKDQAREEHDVVHVRRPKRRVEIVSDEGIDRASEIASGLPMNMRGIELYRDLFFVVVFDHEHSTEGRQELKSIVQIEPEAARLIATRAVQFGHELALIVKANRGKEAAFRSQGNPGRMDVIAGKMIDNRRVVASVRQPAHAQNFAERFRVVSQRLLGRGYHSSLHVIYVQQTAVPIVHEEIHVWRQIAVEVRSINPQCKFRVRPLGQSRLKE